ncbi:MAG: phosphoribosylanthranilate isomerase [Candidatus Omnitrophica bacterium]|nr:phosphoribosylanthranilate isomerase [Candidatus Omnitrophota bacterium]MBU4590054.1 phosphoribosylanthranilate isomerase [Candidatus Omnitrophota bacterium]
MIRVRVKFCGITSAADAEKAVEAGADALGFVFFKESPRYVTPEDAERIIRDLPPFISKVGIFVNDDLAFIEECVTRRGLNTVQLHGDEDTRYCVAFKDMKLKGVSLIKAIRVKDRESLSLIEECPADAFLLDAYKSNVYGGTGKGFDRTLAIVAGEYCRRIIVAGGLTPDNVYDLIKETRPYAVDVSSGIESSPGRKNVELMEEFMGEVRRTEED